MAISIQFQDTANNYKTAAHVYQLNVIPRADVQVGDFIIAAVAADADAAPTLVRLADTNQEDYTFTTVVTATNAGNTVASISWAVIDALPTGSGDIDWWILGLDAGDAKACAVYIVRGLDSSPFDKASSGTGSGTTHSSGATPALSQADELVIGAIGTEHKLSELAGSWTTGAGYVSGNEQSDGTEANGSAANIVIRSAAEIVSATTAQTAEITSEGDCDWAACIATFKAGAGGISVTPAHAEAGASCISPSIIMGSTSASPAHAEAEALLMDPAVVLGSLNITPAIAEAEALALDPAVIKGSLNITPAYAETEALAEDPGVVLGSTSASPAHAEAEAAALDPSVQAGGGVEVTPAHAEALASALDPLVVLGSLLITPAVAEALAAAVDPAVVMGSLSLTPGVAESLAQGIDPVVVLGSIIFTPAVAEALAAAVDPSVQTGGVFLTPAIAEALAATIDPAVVMGSTSVTPAQAIALALAMNPSVLEGEPALKRWVALNLLTLGVGGRRA